MGWVCQGVRRHQIRTGRRQQGTRRVFHQLGGQGPRCIEELLRELGFRVFAGDVGQNWLLVKNGDHAIGLFQSLFERNILTFNSGWDADARSLAAFTDVRELQRRLKARGVPFQQEADESTTGPASLMIVDPDGTGAIDLVAEVALSDPTVPFVMACARLDNLASQRAFAKAGFRKDREFDDVPNGLHVLMVRRRQEGQLA